MIKLAGGIVFRVFVEFGLVLLAGAVLFFVLAFRFGRRLWTSEPDKLDRMSLELARLLSIGLVAAKRAQLDDDDELVDDPGVAQVDFYGEVDWRELVV